MTSPNHLAQTHPFGLGRLCPMSPFKVFSQNGIDSLVKYIGIPKRFIAGEVVLQGKENECAWSVKIILEGNGKKMETVSDVFGDF
jgi:hypothetical protein